MRIAYHPNLPEDFYTTVKYLNEDKTADIQFYSAKSLHQKYNFYAERTIDIVQKSGVKVLDYSQFILDLINDPEKPYINKPLDLYIDEYHFSTQGSLLVAKFLAKKMSPLVEEKIKNQNK